jgi:molybdopterin-guanine dinucleotide biosynthesis protein A
VIDISGVILAGGKSRRLGVDKAFLTLGGRTLITRAIETMRQVTDDVIVVTNDPGRFATLGAEVRLVPDAFPRAAALVGLYSGLQAAAHDQALVVGCDMPFLNIRLLRHLVEIRPECDVVIPRRAQGLETLHARYSRRCLPAIERLLHAGGAVIFDFFPEVDVCYVDEPELRAFDPEGRSFVNVNTPQDWERVQMMEKDRTEQRGS